jgi:restriction system protein
MPERRKEKKGEVSFVINSSIPDQWRKLQSDVAQILSECGFNTETEKNITTARGEVEIDVFAEDPMQTPHTIYLCECKHWNANVPKSEVHAFRTVVNDFGANWGLVISKQGFQRGAYEAAKNTNLKLLDWQEFQALFAERWYREHMVKKLTEEAAPIMEYTEPINSRIFRKADALPSESQERFRSLRKRYVLLGFLAMQFSVYSLPFQEGLPKLPLLKEQQFKRTEELGEIPADILQATSLRGLLNSMVNHLRTGTAEFDEVFGERA